MWMFFLSMLGFGLGYALGRNNTGSRSKVFDIPTSEGGQAVSREHQFGHLKSILLALHEMRGKKLDTSQMDELLDVSELPSEETKRSRRARMISDVNAWGWSEIDRPVLTRLRDDEDRRRTLYVVEEFTLPSWATPELNRE